MRPSIRSQVEFNKNFATKVKNILTSSWDPCRIIAIGVGILTIVTLPSAPTPILNIVVGGICAGWMLGGKYYLLKLANQRLLIYERYEQGPVWEEKEGVLPSDNKKKRRGNRFSSGQPDKAMQAITNLLTREDREDRELSLEEVRARPISVPEEVYRFSIDQTIKLGRLNAHGNFQNLMNEVLYNALYALPESFQKQIADNPRGKDVFTFLVTECSPLISIQTYNNENSLYFSIGKFSPAIRAKFNIKGDIHITYNTLAIIFKNILLLVSQGKTLDQTLVQDQILKIAQASLPNEQVENAESEILSKSVQLDSCAELMRGSYGDRIPGLAKTLTTFNVSNGTMLESSTPESLPPRLQRKYVEFLKHHRANLAFSQSLAKKANQCFEESLIIRKALQHLFFESRFLKLQTEGHAVSRQKMMDYTEDQQALMAQQPGYLQQINLHFYKIKTEIKKYEACQKKMNDLYCDLEVAVGKASNIDRLLSGAKTSIVQPSIDDSQSEVDNASGEEETAAEGKSSIEFQEVDEQKTETESQVVKEQRAKEEAKRQQELMTREKVICMQEKKSKQELKATQDIKLAKRPKTQLGSYQSSPLAFSSSSLGDNSSDDFDRKHSREVIQLVDFVNIRGLDKGINDTLKDMVYMSQFSLNVEDAEAAHLECCHILLVCADLMDQVKQRGGTNFFSKKLAQDFRDVIYHSRAFREYFSTVSIEDLKNMMRGIVKYVQSVNSSGTTAKPSTGVILSSIQSPVFSKIVELGGQALRDEQAKLSAEDYLVLLKQHYHDWYQHQFCDLPYREPYQTYKKGALKFSNACYNVCWESLYRISCDVNTPPSVVNLIRKTLRDYPNPASADSARETRHIDPLGNTARLTPAFLSLIQQVGVRDQVVANESNVVISTSTGAQVSSTTFTSSLSRRQILH